MTYDVESRTVTLSHDDLALHTLVYRPKGVEPPEGGWPVVICSHGFRATFAAAEPYAQAFASEGRLAVAFDFCGGGPGSMSSGDPSRMSPLTERQDLECVFDYVRGLPEVDAGRVALMGQSQGGLVSAMLACRRPDDVEALLLLYPALCIREDMMGKFRRPDAVPMLFDHMGTQLGRIYAVDAMAWEPYSHLESYAGPVRIWHGDADELVHIGYSERALEVWKQGELTVVPGAGHGFGERRVEVISELLAFLASVE